MRQFRKDRTPDAKRFKRRQTHLLTLPERGGGGHALGLHTPRGTWYVRSASSHNMHLTQDSFHETATANQPTLESGF